MDTIRPYLWIAAGVCGVVWLLWLVLGGIFSAASSVLPHAWLIILLAVIIGVVAWVLRYPATEINALGENKIVWGTFQTLLVVGFIALFIQAALWIHSSNFLLWAGIDASPRVRAFMSVVVVGLCLFPLPPLINWIIPTSGIFAKAVWRILFATSFLLLVSTAFLPKMFFDPITGKALVTIDSEGNTFYDPAKKVSPATQEPLKSITPEQAKKIRPWWEQVWGTVANWNEERRAAAEEARKKAEEARPLDGAGIATTTSLSANPECTRIQRAEGIVSGSQAVRSMYVENRCIEFFFEQHDYRGWVEFVNNPCAELPTSTRAGVNPLFQAVSGSPQLWGFGFSPEWWGGTTLDASGKKLAWEGPVRLEKPIAAFRAVTKLSCVS